MLCTEYPLSSVSVYALSAMIIASSTTIPTTIMKANKLMMLIETSTASSNMKPPSTAVMRPTITQIAILKCKKMPRRMKTRQAPINMLMAMACWRSLSISD